MVRVSSMLLGVAVGASAATSSSAASAFDALPSFAIPSFDYPSIGQGATPERLLAELQTNGIVALRNVPNYANVRAAYLQKAAECAIAAADAADADASSFLSQKQFADGTKRYTISTNAGSELAGAAANTQTTCPGYQELYQEFSQLVERAVNTFGSTLDATSFTASDGAAAITSRKLVSEAIRLDHFHAYEAASRTSETQQSRELAYSLPLHEDHGLFIAMSAPKFYEVQERKLVERELAADRSGLVIQTSAGQRVRPVLNEDEVVIMMGTGASRWLKTSHALPAVLHAMKMPESAVNSDSRVLRAWFGKMTLLPAYQRMLSNQGVVFDAHVNSTTRFLLQKSDESELKTIGCAGDRRLEASEGSCTVRTCSTKSGSTAPSEGCATICNRKGHSDTDDSECASKCTCSDQANSAERCWMLCVANLPVDVCPKASQTCKGQTISCTVPTTAPSTGASASTTPNPSSASGSTSGDVAVSSSSSAGTPSSATVTAPVPTTATPQSTAISVGLPSAAVLVASLVALAHALLQ